MRAMKPKVMQILINLFRNATQAMDAGGGRDKVLAIRVSWNGDNRVKIAVSDNGIGISARISSACFSTDLRPRRMVTDLDCTAA